MYSQQELNQEIESQYFALESKSERAVPKSQLVTLVLLQHDGIQGEDRDFALYCVQLAVSDSVNRYFRDLKESEKEESSTRPTLPGFERLQRRYVITRDGEQTIVHISDMSDEEIETKAVEHESMAKGHRQHAKELRQFSEQRAKKIA